MDDIITPGEVTPFVLASLKTRQVGPRALRTSTSSTLRSAPKRSNCCASSWEESDLDAVVCPTVRRSAAKLGEPQLGSTCSLSANTGFPALTVPAGLSPEGLPIGVEMLGLPFTKPTLLGMGYDYEQATHHRVPPTSTPH